MSGDRVPTSIMAKAPLGASESCPDRRHSGAPRCISINPIVRGRQCGKQIDRSHACRSARRDLAGIRGRHPADPEDRQPHARTHTRERVYTRALTIAGGTTQVNKNIIAQRLLGMPRA